MDETAWLSPNRTHHTLFVSGLVDTRTGQLLDVIEDRTARAVTSWLGHRDPAWLARIGVVALDPYRGYATAMGVHLGHAKLVVDHWHVIRLANACVDEVRRRVQQQTLGHRGGAGDPLYRIRKLAVMAAERLDARGWHRLAAGLTAGCQGTANLVVWCTPNRVGRPGCHAGRWRSPFSVVRVRSLSR